MAGTVVALCLFLLTITGFASAETVTVGNTNYFVSETKANWYESRRICKAEHGMVLVDIINEKEHSRIMDLIKPHMDKPDARFWTSGSDLGSRGSFYWASSGHGMLYSDWHLTQPDNEDGNENCVEISKLHNFKWNDANCNLELYYICRNSVSYPQNNCICLNA